MSLETEFDVTGIIARLFIYPVKSCAGIEVQEAVLTETGLDLDRAWMVVDAQGHFLTQRTLPRMALIRPQLKSSEMVLRAPGMLALHVALDVVEGPATVTVWDDTVPAWDMGALAAQWFSDFLGQPCRLVRHIPIRGTEQSCRGLSITDRLANPACGIAKVIMVEVISGQIAAALGCQTQSRGLITALADIQLLLPQ